MNTSDWEEHSASRLPVDLLRLLPLMSDFPASVGQCDDSYPTHQKQRSAQKLKLLNNERWDISDVYIFFLYSFFSFKSYFWFWVRFAEPEFSCSFLLKIKIKTIMRITICYHEVYSYNGVIHMLLIFTNMPLKFRICNPRQSATPSILLDDVVVIELILHHMC